MEENQKTQEVEVFMCKVDWEYHLDDDPFGVQVFSRIDHCAIGRPCTIECGIVKVKMTFMEVVQPENYNNYDDSGEFP